MSAVHTWRFAAQGLLKRRPPASDADGCYARQDLPRRVGTAPRLPGSPLPSGLLPLPTGFERVATTGRARPYLDTVAAGR
ncbi:hypothetical protein OG226_19110 [Streptomyces sp. NBC_01261]|uniref:hypothetical protein n=1 Tax=unclassified Streptomyces TaxID=2593676 RepID=UPI002E2ADD14|nr:MULTISPECIES: hypothetical protein [unclassified Streptomyces]